MPYCPACKTELEVGADYCPGCGADVSEVTTGEGDAPVRVLRAESPEEALVAEATLEAEGIPAYVMSGDPVLPNIGNLEDRD